MCRSTVCALIRPTSLPLRTSSNSCPLGETGPAERCGVRDSRRSRSPPDACSRSGPLNDLLPGTAAAPRWVRPPRRRSTAPPSPRSVDVARPPAPRRRHRAGPGPPRSAPAVRRGPRVGGRRGRRSRPPRARVAGAMLPARSRPRWSCAGRGERAHLARAVAAQRCGRACPAAQAGDGGWDDTCAARRSPSCHGWARGRDGWLRRPPELPSTAQAVPPLPCRSSQRWALRGCEARRARVRLRAGLDIRASRARRPASEQSLPDPTTTLRPRPRRCPDAPRHRLLTQRGFALAHPRDTWIAQIARPMTPAARTAGASLSADR